ncbi:UNVERIFIED_CONTAM: Calmodulin-binding transcription activator 3 [Sesamum radiatum]|uniref:Calmodulin-binding transcription activator 3 n=1 Tax=Sesamum radiatum TaxID=300843 RepID=A0AAW2JVY9_SESRA
MQMDALPSMGSIVIWEMVFCCLYNISSPRERIVAFVISLGVALEALTDTTPTYPAGRPPAELAANNGHKGIAGYLSDSLLSSLSSHISLLNLEDSNEGNDRGKAVETATGRIATPAGYGDLPHGLSMKDSLAVVVYDKVLNNREVDFDDDLIDLEALLDDDTLMQIASYL